MPNSQLWSPLSGATQVTADFRREIAQLDEAARPSARTGNSGEAALQPILPDNSDEFAGSDVPMGPQGQAAALHKDMALEHFICHLQIRAQERCTVVTSNEQGAQCIAVASPKPGCYNTLLVGHHMRSTRRLAVHGI